MPFKPVQDSTFSWAFSDSKKFKQDYAEWFRLLMVGHLPARVSPMPFTADERQRLKVPALFVFGNEEGWL